MAALVAHGFGIALVPRLAPVPREPKLVRVPLRDSPSPVRRLVARGPAGDTDARPFPAWPPGPVPVNGS
ncbi:hypothetical protein [Streptomyces sp. cg2]|uniref:hypothetical protein n=1 Tax=Streptomyces sp. cg2 TaxID=3238799 RepID=UPI0034E1A5E0